jgi:FkbM family methyltransferase
MLKYLSPLFLLLHTVCFGVYHSQCGQDRFVNQNYFKNTRNGVFVDIGAHNGVKFSNTCFFEKELGWTGICVEPIPSVFAKLEKNRNCILVNGCISDKEGEALFLLFKGPCEMLSGLIDKDNPKLIERAERLVRMKGGSYECVPVQCYLLNHILEEHGIYHINFLSIDTEGAEFDILSTIDFSRFQIDVMTIEDHLPSDCPLVSFLAEKGFRFVKALKQDKIFVNEAFLKKLERHNRKKKQKLAS